MSSSPELSREVGALLALCREISSPIAYKAECFALKGDWEAYLGLKVEPRYYVSAEHYLGDAQVAAFLKKHPSLPIKVDLEAKAVASFYAAERSCYVTNERLNPLLTDRGHYGARIAEFIRVWRKEIRRVLRRAPLIERLEGKFGPGSTYENIGDEITVAHKLQNSYTATMTASQTFLPTWDRSAWSRYAACGLSLVGDDFVAEQEGVMLYSDPAWNFREPEGFRIVKGNRFTTVPKTALTRRGICVEPSLNVFYQLGAGKELSRRMAQGLGWNKENCQVLHQELARIGSLTGSIATIDLSAASDTVCKNLVKLLLPKDWYDLLSRLRSPYTSIDGKEVRLEKFSSMGNGYTFELETLLFFTLCLAVKRCSREVEDYTVGSMISCFGDDIIIPTVYAKDVIAALTFFGFTINKDKTFIDGPFRESCGGDFFKGLDVRPYFQKVELNEPHQLISCFNGITRYYHRRNITNSNRGGGYRAGFWLQNQLPAGIRRCKGPPELGDLCLHDPDPRRWSTVTRNSIRYVRVWRPVPNREIPWNHFRPGVVHAAALYRAGNPTRKTVTERLSGRPDGWTPRLRGSYVSGYRFGRVAYS